MSKVRKTRVGVVGCGFYGQNHLNSWNDLQDGTVSMVAVCDLDEEKSRTAGRTFGVSWYTDLDCMLREVEIDLLDVVTRMDTHRSIAAKAAARGIGAILQKPLAPNLEECAEIVNTARKHGTWLAVHENFRFGTAMRHVKSIIDSGGIGDANWGRISFRTGYDVYSGQPYLAREERLAILNCGKRSDKA